MIIGYARVNTKSQSLASQVKELEEFRCDKIFEEKQSGKSFSERPVYNEMRNKIRFGDVLVVHDLSNLGRNKEEIKNEWEFLMKGEVNIVVLNIPILDTVKYKGLEDVRKLVSEIVIALLSWMVDEERELIRSVQRKGIEIARKQGKYKGRKKKYHANATGKDKVIYETIIKEFEKNTSVMDIHRMTGVARSTIYIIKKEVLSKI